MKGLILAQIQGGGSLMVSFLALYRGNSIHAAQLISVSTNPEIVNYVAKSLLSCQKVNENGDPAMETLVQGRIGALEKIAEESDKEVQVAKGIETDG